MIDAKRIAGRLHRLFNVVWIIVFPSYYQQFFEPTVDEQLILKLKAEIARSQKILLGLAS